MSKRIEDVRKRISKRRAMESKWQQNEQKNSKTVNPELDENDRFTYSYDDLVEKQGNNQNVRSTFLIRLLLSAITVLCLAIVLKSNSPMSGKVHSVIQKLFSQEFQFASATKWYEDHFGSPLTFFQKNKINIAHNSNQNLAVPASGKVLQNFKIDGKGVIIQTNQNQKVEAMKEGVVLFVGNKDSLGKTVIIQHADGSESWYGKLNETNVSVSDRVESKQVIGRVSPTNDGKYGSYYFAIKMGEHFIDPKKVMSFE